VKEDTQVSERVRVGHVVADSPAADAGIQPGDEFIEFAGVRINDFDALKKQVQLHQPGKNVNVQVRRGEETIQFELRIGALRQRETQK
jgi:regulator of sigma E protease